MVEDPGELSENDKEAAPPRRRKALRGLGWAGLVLAALLALAWFNRGAIVERIISGQLSSLGLPGKYRLESAGLGTQVLTDIVIGDPVQPDLTVERAEVTVVPTFGLPTVGRVKLVRARLFGTVRQARASFGSLDRLLFAKSEKPAGLPDMDLVLDDARARLVTDYGVIGIKAEGQGNLSDGFSGIVAAAAPQAAIGGCQITRASLFGRVQITAAHPQFSGPLRLGGVFCPAQGRRLAASSAQIEARTTQAFDSVAGRLGLQGGALGWGGAAAAGLDGAADFSLARGELTTRYRLGGKQVTAAYGSAAALELEGLLRGHDSLARFEGEGALTGRGLSPGRDLDAALKRISAGGRDSLAAPLAGQLHAALLHEAGGSRLSANYLLRSDGQGVSLTVSRAVVQGGSGAQVLALSRFQLRRAGDGVPRLSGNVATGGAGFPQLSGRITGRGDGSLGGRFTMAEYRAGTSRIALPSLVVTQLRGGEIGLSGWAELSGALPGGRVDRLRIPLDGNWSARRGLSLWRRCIALSYDRLALSGLSLDPQSLSLCPGSRGAILRQDASGLHIAAGTRGLALSGRIGETRLHLRSGPLGLAWPGALVARSVEAELGDPAAPSRLKIADLRARLGSDITGTFAGAEARLAAVPLDLLDGAGQWRFAGGVLDLSGASLRLEDRQVADRFRPLIARDGRLTLRDGLIDAEVMLREPHSDRSVVKAVIHHDLARAIGHADLAFPALVFDQKMQPDTLSELALGVIANARGTVAGDGRIDWTPRGVTSTGAFSTEGLDFAAAFGPTHGVKGRVEFSDLLGLVTRPDQRLAIASINPGIEVLDGEVSFQLTGNNTLVINGARWPFVDGTLELLPTRMVFGAAEVRRYTLRLTGANAARFIERLELGNLAASGLFDGDIPIVFDQDGGHVVGGKLASRPPGGNVSYVGELTYKDLSPMANMAFQSLRSLDYKRMEIGLDGNLDGEIVTRLQFAGVSQGLGAKSNIATRAIKGLPIQFNVNIRAPFQKLISSFKSMYDPAYIIDPRTLGLIGQDGKAPPGPPPTVQPPVSRNRP